MEEIAKYETQSQFMSCDIKDLAASLASAQAELCHAKKDSDNPYFKSKYADLSSIIEAMRLPLSKNGLSYTQIAEYENDLVGVTTILMHKSGQWIKGTLKLRPVKTDPQSCGSAITYARRYSLQSIVGLSAEEDDDGNKASGQNVVKPQQAKPDKHDTAKSSKLNDLDQGNATTLPINPASTHPATKADTNRILQWGRDRNLTNKDVKAFVDWYKITHAEPEKITQAGALDLFSHIEKYFDEFTNLSKPVEPEILIPATELDDIPA
jgi:hypothetical protein